MHFTTITLLCAGALAAPAPITPQINTASCSLEYKSYFGTYTVNVGRPYNNGDGCDYVKDKIHEQMTISSDPGFKCKDNGTGGTVLTFSTNTKTSNSKVNAGLGAAYPMVGFACDPYNP